MARWPFVAFVVCACLFTYNSGSAASKNGAALVKQCQVSANLAVIACHLYVHAVLDILEKDSVDGQRACLPEGTDIDQSVKAIIDWLPKHPEMGQKPAPNLVAHALSESYPCR